MRVPVWAQYLAVLAAAFAVGSLAGNLRGALSSSPAPVRRPEPPPASEPAPPISQAEPPAPVAAPPPAAPAPAPLAAQPPPPPPAPNLGRPQTPGGTLPRRERSALPRPSAAPSRSPAQAIASAPVQAAAPQPSPGPPSRIPPSLPSAPNRDQVRAMYLLRSHILAAMPEMRRRSAPCASQPGGVGVSGAVRLRAQVEPLLGEFRLANPVPELGPAPGDARTACVAEALRDTTYPAPPAQPGDGFPMPLHLELPPAP